MYFLAWDDILLQVGGSLMCGRSNKINQYTCNCVNVMNHDLRIYLSSGNV